MNTWYMRNQESVVENETYKVSWDFVMKTDHLISARRPNMRLSTTKKKRTNWIADFAALQKKEKREIRKIKMISWTLTWVYIYNDFYLAKQQIYPLKNIT